jgi:nucleoside-diphosphate-sugar epimerase
MAIHRMINAALRQDPFPLFGDGSAVRDFTYVDDVVDANVRAAEADVQPGTVLNVAGGSSTTVRELLEIVAHATGRPVPVEQRAVQSGDVRQTGGSTERAVQLLAWRPLVDLETGVARQVAWHRESGETQATSS